MSNDATATTLTRSDVERSEYGTRVYLPAGGAAPLFRNYGRIENPYEVERYFGQWEQSVVVDNMLRRVTPLGGICNQWVDAINRIDFAIKPGDPNNETSLRMAADARRFVRNLDDLQLASEKLLTCRYYGYYPVEPVYGICPVTGLLGPVKLFTIPPWHVSFDKDDNAYYGRWGGSRGEQAVPPGKLIISRWGSNFTSYGEPILRNGYRSVWRIDILTRLGLQALEILNRPIPWVKYPERWDDAQVDELEERMIKKYKFCVMTPWSGNDVEIEWPTGAITASGAAGRSEFDRVNDEIRFLYILILGTPQTQSEQNASRGLETTRKEIRDDKTPVGAQMRDRWLTRGILDPLGMLNWPNQPRQLWPVFDSDTSEVANAGINGAQAQALVMILTQVAMQQMAGTAAIEAICALGVPRQKAILMVQTTIDERGTLKTPSQILPFPSSTEKEEEEKKAA